MNHSQARGTGVLAGRRSAFTEEKGDMQTRTSFLALLLAAGMAVAPEARGQEAAPPNPAPAAPLIVAPAATATYL
jgi:hypothetical protein